MGGSGGRLVFVGLVQDRLFFDDSGFHRRELTLFASRNPWSDDFRKIIRQFEAGEIDTTLWITRPLPFSEVPQRFAHIAMDPPLLKAMVAVT